LHATPIHKITRRDIAAHLNGPPVAAARARSRLMACCRWAIEQGLIEANPVIGTGIPDKHIKPRERVLSLDEIAAIWKACDGPNAYDTIIRLLIVTACRRQEIGSLRHSELDWENGLLIIPPDRAKSKRTHTLPLPPLAWSIIDSWVERGAFPDHLFSGKGFQGVGDQQERSGSTLRYRAVGFTRSATERRNSPW
jgi:integrase